MIPRIKVSSSGVISLKGFSNSSSVGFSISGSSIELST
jgi:hypothetical protein